MPTFESETRSTTASKQCIHGGGSLGNAGNRWYDKTIQVIFFKVQKLFLYIFITVHNWTRWNKWSYIRALSERRPTYCSNDRLYYRLHVTFA